MNKITSLLSNIFLKPIIKFLFIKNIKGRENIPKQNFILASNHQSYLDIPFCGIICVPRKFTYIGQIDGHKGFKSFIVKTIYSMGGVIPLNRQDKESKKEVISKAIDKVKKGYSIIIYPEGTRSENGQVKEGKLGAAKIFLKTGVPILPVGIKGAYNLFPKGGKLKIKKNVELIIGRPLLFEKEFNLARNLSPDSEEYLEVCIQITNQIMEEIKKLVYEN
jgi:1-acyl-sn-glycerol-3-phosphate acyltransferase